MPKHLMTMLMFVAWWETPKWDGRFWNDFTVRKMFLDFNSLTADYGDPFSGTRVRKNFNT